jgi:hypothetical protein
MQRVDFSCFYMMSLHEFHVKNTRNDLGDKAKLNEGMFCINVGKVL